MKTYLTEEGVEKYTKMCEGYDLSAYKEHFLKYLKNGSRLLELGMGPGNDYKWLSELYHVTGSDYSKLFIDRAKKLFPKGEFKILDAVSIEIDKQYDCIFSSKVYQSFELDVVEKALMKQLELLTENGVIIHTMWIGDQVFEEDDYKAIYHDEARLKELVGKYFDVVEWITYTEFEENDSVFFVAKRK